MAGIAPDVPTLSNFVEGRWIPGGAEARELVNPVNGEVVALAGTSGVDYGKALEFARKNGGPALRRLTFFERAAELRKVADVLAEHRERWYEIARINSGNTKADATIDIEGAIGTLKYFARLGTSLGESQILGDGGPEPLSRDPDFQAIHIGVPLRGVAVHINAYNFPAWGLWEKAAVSLLSGVPILAKPATRTAWLAQEMIEKVVEAARLPEGALSIVCGPAGDLLRHLQPEDVVCFTGSAATSRKVRNHPTVSRESVRVNVEADSLNAAVLGPDAKANDPPFDLFVREVVREITVKAGQKCTAIRRILVPASLSDTVLQAVESGLRGVDVGDPVNSSVGMGPLVDMTQRSDVEDGIRKLSGAAEIVFQTDPSDVDGDIEKGAFIGPTLFRTRSESPVVNELEVFGPVATLVPYESNGDAFEIAERGGGSLAVSVFSADLDFLEEAAIALGPSHGRVLLVDPSIGDSHTGHGIVMPSCTHGGPGRAGGGEELGGLRGLWFYNRRVAMQGSVPVIERISGGGESAE